MIDEAGDDIAAKKKKAKSEDTRYDSIRSEEL
jgi:hypothetical protein